MHIPTNADPMGQAIHDYFTTHKAGRLRVASSMFDDDEMPVATLFRTPSEMNAMERRALQLAHGRVLDVGAGAGCHALPLQEAGAEVTAIDVSPRSVETMRERGVQAAFVADFFATDDKATIGTGYDTVIMLMNGLGLAGRLANLPNFFARLDEVLAPGGMLLADSSDLRYVFEDEDGTFDASEFDDYYGEVDFQMVYGTTKGPLFDWLYVDFDTFAAAADKAGFHAERVMTGEHYDYLCCVRRKAASSTQGVEK